MAKPIEIKLDADTRGAEDGAERVANALGEVEAALDDATAAGKDNSRALDDVADKSQDAGRALDDVADTESGLARAEDAIDQLGDAARDAGRDAETLDRDFTTAVDNIADESRRAGDELGDNVKRGTDRADDALNDFRGEAGSTAREGAASFTGEWDDVGDVVQETLANAFEGFGPVGAAAGVAAAVGFGTLYAAITKDAEKSEDRVSAMYDDMLESQSKYLSNSYILEEMQKIASGADDAIIRFEDLQSIADDAGVSLEDAARAYIGGGEDLIDLLDRTRDRISRNTELQTTGDLLALQGNNENTRALQDRQDEIDEASDRMSRFNELGGRKVRKEVEMRDNAPDVERRIDRAARDRRTDVRVGDRGTARDVQREIHDIRGTSVPVSVHPDWNSINNLYNTVAGIRLPALTVQVRYGQAAV